MSVLDMIVKHLSKINYEALTSDAVKKKTDARHVRIAFRIQGSLPF